MEQIEKFIKIIMITSLLIFVGLAAFDLAPFLFPKEYLIKQTNKDLKQFIQTDKILDSTRYTFLKKDNNVSCAFNRYTNYQVCRGGR